MRLGNKKQISFELEETPISLEFENLTFYLGCQLISKESVHKLTYINSFQSFVELLSKGHFKNDKFKNLTAKKRIEFLLKERDVDEDQFFKHLFQVDESIDQYYIFVFQLNHITEFIWTCWDTHNCNSDHEVDQIYSTQILTAELVTTVDELNSELKRRIASNR